MQEWQKEILEREGYAIVWKNGSTTKIVDGEIITIVEKN